ncbi:MAG: flippase-like domain-containing protein [Magnetovibrio sp.]|nr:flippase-like domain-containing protein [Magnetovibrio sp.]
MTMITRRRVGVALKIMISVVLVWALMGSVGAQGALDRMLDVSPLWLSVALALGAVQMLIGMVRWRAVLVALDAPMSWGQTFRFMYIGAFFNQTLPSSVGGDAVRGYLAYRAGMGLGPAVNGVLLDRIATVLALVLLVVVVMPFAVVTGEGAQWFAQGVWIVLVLALVGTETLMLLDRLPSNWQRFRLIAGLSVLAADARRAFLHPIRMPVLMFWSVLGHVNLSMIVFSLAVGLGVEISPSQCLLLFPPVLLAQTVPISIAGWGVREGAMIAMFAMAGVSAESTLAVSILFGVVMVVVSMPGGLFWMSSDIKTIKDAQAFAER